MSLNTKLRKVVYGSPRAGQNPLLFMPAGVTGTTWHGTGFEQPPAEQVELDPNALPWELQEEAAPQHNAGRNVYTASGWTVSLATLIGVAAVAGILLWGGW